MWTLIDWLKICPIIFRAWLNYCKSWGAWAALCGPWLQWSNFPKLLPQASQSQTTSSSPDPAQIFNLCMGIRLSTFHWNVKRVGWVKWILVQRQEAESRGMKGPPKKPYTSFVLYILNVIAWSSRGEGGWWPKTLPFLAPAFVFPASIVLHTDACESCFPALIFNILPYTFLSQKSAVRGE